MIYLIRHGQTEYNVAGRWQGQVDSPLTTLGLQQAEQVGLALRDLIDPADTDQGTPGQFVGGACGAANAQSWLRPVPGAFSNVHFNSGGLPQILFSALKPTHRPSGPR